jgi:hypothetical protein
MKKYFIIIVLAFLSTSCIDWGLDTLPLLSDAEIVNFKYEYRYSVNNANGFPMLAYVILPAKTTFSGTNITCEITIPKPSGTFTADVAAKVNLTNIVGYCDVSNAAIIAPIGSSPVLGTVGNFSQPCSYKVTAADGTSKTWIVTTSIAK